jgi:midasin
MVEFIELSAEERKKSLSMSDSDAVLPYLRRILAAARTIATVPTTTGADDHDDSRMEIVETVDERETETAGAYYADQIARQLLTACQTHVLTSSTANLPPIVSVQGEHDVIEEDENDEDFPVLIYQRRRIDYVRGLLRAMAPIAVDVAAHVVSIVQATVTTETTSPRIPDQTAVAAWILFSQWLPVASHITPLVSGLFSLSSFSCPLLLLPPQTLRETGESQKERWLIIEAAHNVCRYYDMRCEHEVMMRWWNWSPIFRWLSNTDGDVEMKDNNDGNEDTDEFPFDLETVVRWYAARVTTYVLHLVPSAVSVYLDRFGARKRVVPWVMHPWAVDQEEFVAQDLYFRGRAQIWKQDGTFFLPAAKQIRILVPLHPYLVDVGSGLVFCKHGAVHENRASTANVVVAESNGQAKASRSRQLVRTVTTAQNICLLGTAMAMDPNPPPILICGPHGSGKSSLVRELSHLFSATAHAASHHDDQLLEIHVDEETDTKTLVGSYTTTDIPGQFEWRAGALTWAVRTGKWVLMEDIDSVPVEIQASLVQLLKERILSLGNGKFEHCHPDFRLFGTMTTSSDSSSRRRTFRGTSGKRLLHPSLWTKVDVEPLPFTELKEIALGLYPSIPESIVDSTLAVFRASDKSGRADEGDEDDGVEPIMGRSNLSIGRPASVRDLFKVLSRIAHGIVFERNVSYTTESQRTLSLAEAVDIFVAPSSDRDVRQEFIRLIAAPVFGISSELALRYVETRRPTILLHDTCTEVGRVKIEVSDSAALARTQSQSFVETDYALRLMESIGVCIRENEPTLLVGETGCGKTTLLQHLAGLSGRELIVQNLSLQTDSTDLLGGYRPLEIQHVARRVYEEFLDLFVSIFSRKQNADFLGYASTVLKKRQWKKLSQSFRRAAKLGLAKVRELSSEATSDSLVVWQSFSETAERFEQQRLACDTGLAFVFTEGALVDAVRKGKWVLLDEINLASSETLQRLCGLLDDRTGSLTLTERGDAIAIERHSGFRIFAAMNPATDAGKKDLNPTIRSRFTEVYVDELLDPVELRVVAGRYIASVLAAGDRPPEHTDIVVAVVDLYLHCRDLAERVLVDGGGQKPRFTLRTLTRALTAARTLVLEQKLPLKRALFEGFELAFQGPLDSNSLKIVQKALYTSLGDGLKKGEMDHPGRRPGGRGDTNTFVAIKPFWIKAGPLDPIDWSEPTESGRSKFILTPSTVSNLRRLARAVASGPWPVLLEGPTSSGKTTLVEYIAARCGHHVVRINNHEHTDIQEYTGGFAADSKGSLSFQDGLLVRALRLGHWVILDELNLAPSEVLEALNRLLDDNRELYLAEINETVKPHPNFRLFATQNPSGAYGGRKPLSRAFRNRFVEIHCGDIPSDEMTSILEKRCACPPSHARMLVSIMNSLRQRRSKSGVFLGKDGFITPRDLLRWAERGASSKVDLAREGYMLLAERLRTEEEKLYVREELETQIKVKIDLDSFYYGDMSQARVLMEKFLSEEANATSRHLFSSIAPTKSLLRLVTLVLRCIEQKEPVLLVGGEPFACVCDIDCF